MAFHSMFEYTGTRAWQDNAVSRWGFPVTIFQPASPITMQGYEDLKDFKQFPAKCVIDFKPKRRVFYHYNWFPEDEDRIVEIFYLMDTPVECDWFLRTKTVTGQGFEQVTPYGDLIFRIVKIGDEGKYRVLRRVCFATAITDSVLYEKLIPKAVP